MIHLMIDGETPSTKPTTGFLTLAAVPFDPILGKVLEGTFYQRINYGNLLSNDFHVDLKTLDWWDTQPLEAYRETFGGTDTVRDVLHYFSLYCSTLNQLYGDIYLWGNGSDFDNVILKGMYDKLELPAPWNFRNNRCYRTLKNLFPEISHTYSGTKHNALDDARNQAEHALALLQHLETLKCRT